VRIRHVPGTEKWRLEEPEKLLKTGGEVDGAAGDVMEEPLDNSTPRQSPGYPLALGIAPYCQRDEAGRSMERMQQRIVTSTSLVLYQ
jgi:hypothetical protein